MPVDLDSYLHSRKAFVEAALDRLFPPATTHPARLYEAARYSLMAGGKRLRPILILASAEAVGGTVEQALPFACAMECVHTYSLIHDDLPAMDDDDLRRGRPTCHKQFDEATAILAGDALLTYAFKLAATPVEGVDRAVLLDVVADLAEQAGLSGMVGGQMLDLLAENRSVTLEELQAVHLRKTGALIRCSCTAGARLAGAGVEQLQRLDCYGRAIGLAFQIMDDLLDEIGDSAVMGKSAGSDRKKAKATYPLLLGVDQARRAAEQLIEEALTALSSFSSSAEPLRALAQFIINRHH